MKKTLIGLFLVLGAASFADAGKIEAKGGTVQEKLVLNTDTK